MNIYPKRSISVLSPFNTVDINERTANIDKETLILCCWHECKHFGICMYMYYQKTNKQTNKQTNKTKQNKQTNKKQTNKQTHQQTNNNDNDIDIVWLFWFGVHHHRKRPPPERPHQQNHSQLGLDRHQQGTATPVLHAAKGAQDPRPSARQTHRFRDQRSDRESFQTDGPLAPAYRHQTPQLCPGHNTHAAGLTGLEPPLRSIRRQHSARDIGCGGTVHQYPP